MAESPVVQRVRELVLPIVADLGLDLYDVERRGGTLRVTVDTLPGSPAGVDLDHRCRTDDERVVMHRTPRAALLAQASALGLPLWEVALPDPCPNAVYEAEMSAVIARARAERVDAIAFGDLFLADIRAYREDMLRGTGLRPVFPLWGADTAALAEGATQE